MRAPCDSVAGRLRSLRAQAIASGRRLFQLVELEGVPVRSFRVRGEFSDVASALQSARKWCVSSCVVREWACLPDGVRVHVNSVEWLLEWRRIAGCGDKQPRGSHSTGGFISPVGGKRSVPGATSKLQG